ncbi:MAG: PA2169 family four-helix-bundle protein [Roseicyclus sp.]
MSKRLENLNAIIAVLGGGAKAYRSAAQSVKNVDLEDVFLKHAELREEIARDLSHLVHKAGAEPAGPAASEQGRTLAAKVGAVLMAKPEQEMLIDRLKEHEDRTLEAFRNALHHPDNDEDTEMLEGYLAKVRDSHDRMRAIKHADDPTSEAAQQL